MAVEWRSSTWGEEISLEYGKRLSGYAEGYGQIRVFGTNGPVGWTDEPLAPGPGIIVGRKGAYRGVHYSPNAFYVIDTAYYVRPKTDLHMQWLYYAIIHHELTELNDGSPIPSTTRSAVYIRELAIPPRAEQEEIADILGTLDDKIELNRQMNRTLEAMARAIFKAWFVDFEPVKAKAADAKSFRGMPQAVFDQLPDRFTDTELGPVPEGWEPGELGQVMEHPRRPTKPAGLEEATPYIGLEHMPQKSIAVSEWGQTGSVTSNKHRFYRGELLFGKLRPYFHKVGIAPVDGVCSTDVVVIKPQSPEWFGYVLGHISSSDFVSYTTAASTGTKMPRTNWKDMSRYKTVLPNHDVAHAYSELISPLAEQIIAGIHESRTLAATRDTLLPKLIAGELRVEPPERSTAEAVCR